MPRQRTPREDGMPEHDVTSSVRIPWPLYRAFNHYVADTNRVKNEVFVTLLEEYLREINYFPYDEPGGGRISGPGTGALTTLRA